MSRDLFGTWGAGLTPEDFSAALAGLAAFGPITGFPSEDQIIADAKETRDRSGLIVKVSLSNIAGGIGLIAAGRKIMAGSDFALLWRYFSKHLAPTEDICIELDSTGWDTFHADVPATLWVLRELQRPGGAAGSTYLRGETPGLLFALRRKLETGSLSKPSMLPQSGELILAAGPRAGKFLAKQAIAKKAVAKKPAAKKATAKKPAAKKAVAKKPAAKKAVTKKPTEKKTVAAREPSVKQTAVKKSRAPEKRRVVLNIYDITDKKNRLKVKKRLSPERRYDLELFIGAKRQGTVQARQTFPSKDLPPGANVLSVYFVPLVRAINGDVLPSQHKKLRLPETEDSKVCRFQFQVPPTIELYRARIIIAYRNRVLQTLILSAPVGDAEGELLLDIENIIDPSFEKLAEHPRFDAAIVINDSPSGVPGVTAMRGSEAVFSEPEELNKMTDDLRDFILKKAAYLAKRKYECKNTRDLIYGLSRKGKSLWDNLSEEAHDLLKDVTKRIQIVDARNGAYYPAEFVYRGRSPRKDATLCPNSAAALQRPVGTYPTGGTQHEKCEHRDDPDFICPLRMWGFGIVIERQPATGGPHSGFILRDITDIPGGIRKGMFDHAVVSVSARVTKADHNAAKDLVVALGKVAKRVSVAKNWTALTKIVQEDSPTLLVLLPHSGMDKEDQTIPALELGNEWLAYDRLERDHIRGPLSDRPILLLLGCDTNTAEIPFLNFIKRFKDCGAAMVVGTITQIEALRTVDFVERFTEAVAASSTRSVTFGELLLQTRRRMLACGDGYALSLLAYGDSDQRTA